MIEKFLVYSFGKLVNCTVWNWICTASDKFSFFLFFLFSPGSKRSKSRAMRADVSFVTVCCAHCNSSRSNQNLGSTVTTSASRVVFSRLMNGGKKNSKFERSNRSHTKPLVHQGFSHSLVFWKELTIYLRSCNLCLQFETSE